MDEIAEQAEGLATDSTTVQSDSTLVAEPTEGTPEAVVETPPAPSHTVKVNGEDVSVTLEELLSGYQRQSDYTRKTQEIAKQAAGLKRASAIQEAFDRDPREAMRALAEAYGVDTAPEADDEFADPIEKRQNALEKQLREMQHAARQSDIDRTLNTLRDTYGEFDEDSLFAHSLKTGIRDLGAAYRDMTYDDHVAQAKSTAAAEAAAEAKLQAKREASVVHEGGIPKSATAPKQGSARPTIREAWAESARELGIAI